MQNPLQFIHARSVILEFISHPFTAECKCNWEQCNCSSVLREVHKGAVFGVRKQRELKKKVHFLALLGINNKFQAWLDFWHRHDSFPRFRTFFFCCCRLYLRAQKMPSFVLRGGKKSFSSLHCFERNLERTKLKCLRCRPDFLFFFFWLRADCPLRTKWSQWQRFWYFFLFW